MTVATPRHADRELLAQCRLLTDLPAEALDAMLHIATQRRFDASDTVIERGTLGETMYFILAGGVKVSMLSRDGKEVTFDVLTAGDFFGEMSLFDGKPRTGTVTTLVPTRVAILDKAAFLSVLARHPTVAVELVRALTGRLRMMDGFVADVLFLDAQARLAKRVVALAGMFGCVGADGETRFDLKMSQQEFANLVGITRESVNKQFRNWERQGVIGIADGFLVLRDSAWLAALAEAGG